MLKNPKISIITPTLNQGRFLAKTIKSVVFQDYDNLEYIIIDGGSKDKTLEIINKYERFLSFWMSEKDNGTADAINKGFTKASGEILGWINSDDVLLHGALRKVSDFFINSPNIDCLIGDLQIIDENDKILTYIKAVPFSFYQALFITGTIPQPATFFTRKAWEKTGRLVTNLPYQFDHEFFLRMAYSGVKFDILKDYLAQFRLHKESKTIREYKKNFYESVSSIQDKYLPSIIKQNKYKRNILKILKFFIKFYIYILKVFLRGDVIPFKALRAKKNMLH